MAREYLSTTAGDDPLSPVWYRYLLPAAASDVFESITLFRPPGSYASGRHVGLSLFYREVEGANVSWVVGLDGRVVQGATMRGDDYNRNPHLPRIEQFFLGDFPPIDSTTDQSSKVRE